MKLPFGEALITGIATITLAGSLACCFILWQQTKENEYLVANNTENLKALKADCEKSLPRDKECILVYEYTAVSM